MQAPQSGNSMGKIIGLKTLVYGPAYKHKRPKVRASESKCRPVTLVELLSFQRGLMMGMSLLRLLQG